MRGNKLNYCQRGFTFSVSPVVILKLQVTKLVNEVYHMYNRHQYPFVALNIAVASGKLLESYFWNSDEDFLYYMSLFVVYFQSVWMWTSPQTNGRFSFRRKNCCWPFWRLLLSTCMRLESIRSVWTTHPFPAPVRTDYYISPVNKHKMLILISFILLFLCFVLYL